MINQIDFRRKKLKQTEPIALSLFFISSCYLPQAPAPIDFDDFALQGLGLA